MQRSDFEDLSKLEEQLWWFRGMRLVTAAVLDPFMSVERPAGKSSSDSGPRILDAGCGVGGNIRWLERYTARENIVGIDVDASALEFLPSDVQPRVTQASVTDLPFHDGTFDLVTSFDVMVQVPDDGEERGFSEMARVLKPGGLLFIRCAANQWLFSEHDRSLHTMRRYSSDRLRQRLTEQGLTIERITYANTALFPFAVIRRKILKPFGLVAEGSDVKPLPAALDGAFFSCLAVEAAFIQRGGSLPFGLSVLAVVRKHAA